MRRAETGAKSRHFHLAGNPALSGVFVTDHGGWVSWPVRARGAYGLQMLAHVHDRSMDNPPVVTLAVQDEMSVRAAHILPGIS